MNCVELNPNPHPKKGRPLSFDREVALGQAMMLFWEHGYEATSLKDLTSAIGVPPSSIYSAFGDKKGLFLEAVDHYLSGPVTSETIITQAATAREAARDLLHAAATGFTGKDTPPGCLLASSAISCSDAAFKVREELARRRRAIESSLKRRIVLAIRTGEIPAKSDADALAAHTMAIIQGMSTLARDGAKREKLLRLADMAMKAWPEPVKKLTTPKAT
jgi:AcrR family transcriptional regulator